MMRQAYHIYARRSSLSDKRIYFTYENTAIYHFKVGICFLASALRCDDLIRLKMAMMLLSMQHADTHFNIFWIGVVLLYSPSMTKVLSCGEPISNRALKTTYKLLIGIFEKGGEPCRGARWSAYDWWSMPMKSSMSEIIEKQEKTSIFIEKQRARARCGVPRQMKSVIDGEGALPSRLWYWALCIFSSVISNAYFIHARAAKFILKQNVHGKMPMHFKNIWVRAQYHSCQINMLDYDGKAPRWAI